MIILVLFAFLAGVVTILSPCILPILPIVLSSTAFGGRLRPLGVIVGFVLGFSFLVLLLSSLVSRLGISANVLRWLAILIIFVFAFSLLIPKFQLFWEKVFSKISGVVRLPGGFAGHGFWSGLMVGLGIGLVWAPCVGPILAAVISLALTGTVSGFSVAVVVAYSLGTALPMSLVAWGGRRVLLLNKSSQKIQQGFGLLMIVVAWLMFFNLDRSFQTFLLEKFPNYGRGLTFLEDNQITANLFSEFGLGQKLSVGQIAPEIIPGGEWFNVSNDQEASLSAWRGQVVLVDFWTYSCVNCLRTLPYLKLWQQEFADQGLVIVGVHTPEFVFEKDPNNLAQAIADLGLTYPIVQDNDYQTWRAFENRYWPAEYLIDQQGTIRYIHFGEGEYSKTEQAIRDLLIEGGQKVSEETLSPESSSTSLFQTPEIYLGYQRMEQLTRGQEIYPDSIFDYSEPIGVGNDRFAFGGRWTVGQESALAGVDSDLFLNFAAKKVYAVLEAIDESQTVKIYLDDQESGEIAVGQPQLYELVDLPAFGRHELRLEFLAGGVRIYTFTFGG